MTKILPLNAAPLKIKIELENLSFPIHRKILVPNELDMYELHVIIQAAMGWENSHLFQFSDKKWKYAIRVQDGVEDADNYGGFFDDVYEASEITLTEFLTHTNGKTFWYWYDFGDDWWHKISIQKVSKKDLSSYRGVPFCTEAVGACPPEDCGGPWGYGHFVNIINDPKHPEYKEMREWMSIGGNKKIDFQLADQQAINGTLAYIWEKWRTENNE